MDTFKSFNLDLYAVNAQRFEDIALQVFHFQAENNAIYSDFVRHLGIRPGAVASLADIPFLPITFFKHHLLKTGAWSAAETFASSGTTGAQTSRHAIRDPVFYRNHALRCFEFFFDKIENFHVLALLPSYLERRDSSLVAMMEHFIRKSGSSHSGFYLDDLPALLRDVEKLRGGKKKILLWGVTFALLDLAGRFHPDLRDCLVVETGGMKGRGEEITRYALHDKLNNAFGTTGIYSEYGMTELLSQAYTRGQQAFFCPPWMKMICREITDPLHKGLLNETGGINVIDLANLDTISFIETEDIGKVYPDGSFEILGRLDNSDMRGCNLLVE